MLPARVKKRRRNILIGGLISILIFLFVISYLAWRKVIAVGKLSVGDINMKLSEPGNIIKNLTNPEVNSAVEIKNYGTNPLTIDSTKLDIYTPSGLLVAEQKTIDKTDTNIPQRGSALLQHTYSVKPFGLKDLLVENGLIPKTLSITDIMTALASLDPRKIKIRLKGFVTAGPVTLPVDEIISLSS
ncbi:MAG: hypothetical protein KJ607_09565 [Bacteroidetes bacterium]|nr:hypothetical protein [Bacteroidota bacterium]